MKRKALALVLTAAITGSLLGGCSTAEEQTRTTDTEDTAAVKTDLQKEVVKSGSSDDIKLSVFWWGSQLRNEKTQQILDMYAAEHPGITFDGQFSADYWTRLATLSAGHTMPDVVQMDYTYISQYAEKGLLTDLTPYIEDGTIDVSNVSEDILETGRVGDGIYAICNGINAPALLYNKTLLDEAGIQIHDYMTLEEFKDVCREVYEKTGYKTSLSYGSNTNGDFLPYLLRAQGKLLYGDGKFAVDSADDFVQFFSVFEDGIKEGWHVDPSLYVERTRGQAEQDCLVYGSSPETMSWCGFYHSNQLVAMQNSAPEGTDIAMTTFPSDNPEISNYLKPSQFFSISTDSKYPDEAAALIDYITNSEECNNVLLGERGVPISSVISEAISVNQSPDEQEVVHYINDVVTPKSTKINPPAPGNASEVFSLIDSLTEKVLYGELTAEEAAALLFEQGNEYLAKE